MLTRHDPKSYHLLYDFIVKYPFLPKTLLLPKQVMLSSAIPAMFQFLPNRVLFHCQSPFLRVAATMRNPPLALLPATRYWRLMFPRTLLARHYRQTAYAAYQPRRLIYKIPPRFRFHKYIPLISIIFLV
jgi:hypothetical protein